MQTNNYSLLLRGKLQTFAGEQPRRGNTSREKTFKQIIQVKLSACQDEKKKGGGTEEKPPREIKSVKLARRARRATWSSATVHECIKFKHKRKT